MLNEQVDPKSGAILLQSLSIEQKIRQPSEQKKIR